MSRPTSMEEADLAKILDNYIHAAFLIPVIDGQIYLCKRGTEPFKGYFGAVGGKSDLLSGNNVLGMPNKIIKPGGQRVKSLADQVAKSLGRENPAEAACREFCEEIFSELKYPQDFSPTDITDVYKLGMVEDQPPGYTKISVCYFHIAQVHRKDFSLSSREVRSFKPLAEITQDEQIFPITKMALEQIRHLCASEEIELVSGSTAYSRMNLEKQIPTIHLSTYKHTDMCGPVMLFKENRLLD